MYENTIEKIDKIKKQLLSVAEYNPIVAADYINTLNTIRNIFSNNNIHYPEEDATLQKIIEYINSLFIFLEKHSIESSSDVQYIVSISSNIFDKLNKLINSYNEKKLFYEKPDLLLNNNNIDGLNLLKEDIHSAYIQNENLEKKINDAIKTLDKNKLASENTLKNFSKKLDTLQEKSNHVDTLFNKHSSLYTTNITILNQKLNTLDRLSEDISKELKNSDQILHRKKLASSFQNRSKLLQKQCSFWLKSIFIIIAFIIYSGIKLHLALPDISEITFDQLNIYIRGYLFHIPIAFTLFWGLWFCCKQYAYTCRLRDDYHYKYDLSTAFYGYNEEVKKLADNDKTIQLALLDFVLKNIGKNPMDTKPIETDCNSPYTEGLKKIHEVITQANTLVTNFKDSLTKNNDANK